MSFALRLNQPPDMGQAWLQGAFNEIDPRYCENEVGTPQLMVVTVTTCTVVTWHSRLDK